MHPAPWRGQQPDFKIAVPEQRRAAVTGRRPPEPLRAPPARQPAFAALRTCSQPRFNQTHWDGTEQAPGTRNTARATTREHAEPRAPAPSRSARRDPTRPAPIAERAGARGLAPRRRDAPRVPPPAPVPSASVSVANWAGASSWRVRCWGAGERGKGRRPPIAALPVRFLWGPERRIDQDEEKKERKGKRKATREGRGALACVPPLGLRAPNAPRLVRGWGGSDSAGSRIWDA